VSKYTRIIGKVTVNNKNVAMVVTADYEKPLQPSDIELVSILCKAVSIEMQKNKTQYNIGWMDYEIFLRDLLEGKYKDNYAVNETARQLGMEFKRYKFVVTVDISTFDHSHHSLPYMKNILEKLSNGKAVVLDDKIVLILSTDKEDISPDTDWNRTVVFLRDNNLFWDSAGRSQTCRKPRNTIYSRQRPCSWEC